LNFVYVPLHSFSIPDMIFLYWNNTLSILIISLSQDNVSLRIYAALHFVDVALRLAKNAKMFCCAAGIGLLCSIELVLELISTFKNLLQHAQEDS